MISQIVNNIYIGTIWDAIHDKTKWDLIICVAEYGSLSSQEFQDLFCQNRTILHIPFMEYPNIETECIKCAHTPSKDCKWCGGHGTVMLTNCYADRKKLDYIADLVIDCILRNMKCILHCAAGAERSPLAMIWTLHKYFRKSLDESFIFVKEKRPIIENRLSWLKLDY